ncbi:MAG: hypothetical protein KBG20_12945 [Caldilineaceae bacterium]|nr:hypothetical protein [Caldilineaceae bacterium]MBP8109365.1 hypothetical protein [Caldilineaceae bacterium]MBP8125725.1 hypothetical protein [Caldilineaceae bacterium]MBP9073204.1 hypothetical protein [Caldilineaceae bacterium]
MSQSIENFLIAEFNALQERALEYERLKSARVNFYLLLIGATIAVMPTMVQQFQAYEWFAVSFVSLTIILVGIATLIQIVNYSISIAVFYRKAGRVRTWFIEKSIDMAPYTAFSPGDDRPRIKLTGTYLALRGAEATVTVGNSIAFGALAYALTSLIPIFGPNGGIIFSIVMAVVILITQYWYVARLLTDGEESGQSEIHFSSSTVVTLQNSYDQKNRDSSSDR